MKALKTMGALAVLTGLALLPALAQNGARCTSDSVRVILFQSIAAFWKWLKTFPKISTTTA